jgi:hypothetical protein
MAFIQYSDPAKAKDVLFDMFLAYVRDPAFGNLSDEERVKTVDMIEEMKNTLLDERQEPQG